MHNHPARTVEAARLLLLGPKQLAQAAKAWAAEAAQDPNQGSLFGKPPTPDQAWATFLKVGGVQPQAPEVKPIPAPSGPPTSERAGWPPDVDPKLLKERFSLRARILGAKVVTEQAELIGALRRFDAEHPDVARFDEFELAVYHRRSLASHVANEEEYAPKFPDVPQRQKFLAEARAELAAFDAKFPEVARAEALRLEYARSLYGSNAPLTEQVREREALQKEWRESFGRGDRSAMQTKVDLWDLANPEAKRAFWSRESEREEADMGRKLRAGYAEEERQYREEQAKPKAEEERSGPGYIGTFAVGMKPTPTEGGSEDPFVGAVMQAAESVSEGGKWGADRVFLRSVYDAMPAAERGSWSEFSARVRAAADAGALKIGTLSQATAMPADLYVQSGLDDATSKAGLRGPPRFLLLPE